MNNKSCKQCLYDEGNYPEIVLDERGICDICKVNEEIIRSSMMFRNETFRKQQVERIKSSRQGKYDCLIGISGGADSTYLVYLAKEWGLNPLLLHVDGGWDSDKSVVNIKSLVEKSGFDYVSHVLNWEEMKDTQRAFVKANVLDIDLPFDNAMLHYNYSIARENNIKFILNGYSVETEGIMPESYTHYKLDKRNILDIQRKFGTKKLKDLQFIGTWDFIVYDKWRKIEFLQPLDWIQYNKTEAVDIIKTQYNWQDYGQKHYENTFTRFYQGHILPKKYNIDKRISHYSMLICSKQISKEAALQIVQTTKPYYQPQLEQDDLQFFKKKLDLTDAEFAHYMATKSASHRDFKSDLDVYDFFRPVYKFIKRLFGVKVFK